MQAEPVQGREAVDDERMLKTATDGFDLGRLFRIVPRATDTVIENPYDVHDICTHMRTATAVMIEKIQDHEFEGQTEACDDHIAGMQVTVVFASRVHLLHPAGERVEQMQARQRREAFAWLIGQELYQRHTGRVVEDDVGDQRASYPRRTLYMVLNDDRTTTQRMQFTRIAF